MKISLWLVTILFVLGGGIALLGCRRKVQQFNDTNVVAGQLRSPMQGFFAHLSEDQYLTVKGKTYTHVRGTAPFYLSIPALHSILIVTGEVDHDAVFHIFDLNSKKEKSIEGGPEDFGWDIGAPRKNGEPFTDYILNATSNQIILAKQGSNSKVQIELNLDNLTIERR